MNAPRIRLLLGLLLLSLQGCRLERDFPCDESLCPQKCSQGQVCYLGTCRGNINRATCAVVTADAGTDTRRDLPTDTGRRDIPGGDLPTDAIAENDLSPIIDAPTDTPTVELSVDVAIGDTVAADQFVDFNVDLLPDAPLDLPPPLPDLTIDSPPVSVDANIDSISDVFNSGATGWTRTALNNPALSTASLGQWDDTAVLQPFVIKTASVYSLWYLGGKGTTFQIGLATSLDGSNFTRYGAAQPVVAVGNTGAWDDFSLFGFCILVDGVDYKMWYSASSTVGGATGEIRRIGYATSTDNGRSWSKYGTQPVFDPAPTATWDKHLQDCFVTKDGSTYQMWYTGQDAIADPVVRQIGYASSSDGIGWSPNPSPVLATGTSGTWDDHSVGFVTVLVEEAAGSNTMWYWASGGVSPPATGVGIAYYDGQTWNKSSAGAIFAGASGQWDSVLVGRPFVRRASNSQLQMWYVGGAAPSTTGAKIGYATSP